MSNKIVTIDNCNLSGILQKNQSYHNLKRLLNRAKLFYQNDNIDNKNKQILY